MRRRMRTRNELKREAIKTAALAVVAFILCAVLTIWAIGIWAEHPGEMQIDGREYIASLQE